MKIARKMLEATVVCFLIAGVLSTESLASDQIPAKKQDHPIALIGGTVHTVSGPVLENATVLFIDGKITAVGEQVTLPEDTEQIDITGKHVYPGLMTANTRLGLVEVGAVRATRDYAEVGDIKPNIRSEVSINPDSEHFPVTRANGITLANTIPMGGLIAGTSAIIMLDGWTWEDMTLKSGTGLYVDWPFMGIRRGPRARQSEEEQRKRRDERIARIKDSFAQARAYLKAKSAEAGNGISYHHGSDLRWEAMAPVLNKEMPVLLHAHGVRQIQAALDWAEDEDVKVILYTGADVRFVLDQIKARNIPVVYEGTHNLPSRRWEPYDTPFAIPGMLHEAEIQFCIAGSGNTFEAPHERNLPYHAAMAAAYGLPKQEALRAVTLYPAQILGIGDRVGSIEVGKDATLIITDGDPLEIMTHVEHEFIQGRKIDLTSRHTMLYEKYQEKYRQLQKLN